MSAMLTATAYLITHLWWVALITLGASMFALGLGRAAGKPMPEMPADSPWLFNDTAFIDTTRFAALKRESDVLFAAEVLDGLDELEVWHG